MVRHARDDARRRRARRRRPCSRARSSPPRSASCGRTTWSGTTSSATTSRARRRRRSTCSTGTATAPTCRGRCTAGTCATPTSRTTSSSRASCRCCGEKIDLGAIDVPTYLYASREDHIVPWEGAYRSTRRAPGQAALRARRLGSHRRRDQPARQGQAQPLDRRGRRVACRSEGWFAAAKEHPGSWWTDWAGWLKGHAGKQVAAPKKPGNAHLQADRAGAGPLRQGQGP